MRTMKIRVFRSTCCFLVAMCGVARATEPADLIVYPAGPITEIAVGQDGSFQVFTSAYPNFGEVYPTQQAPGDAGFFLRQNGFIDGINLNRGTTAAQPTGCIGFHNISQTLAGNKITTVMDNSLDTSGTLFKVTQVTSYHGGDSWFLVQNTVLNENSTPQTVDLFAAADIFLADSDLGYGFVSNNCGTIAVGGSSTPQHKFNIFVQAQPGSPPPTYYQEDVYRVIWATLPFGDFSDTVNAALVDNGAGIEWQGVTIPPGGTYTVSYYWAFGNILSVPVITPPTNITLDSCTGITGLYGITASNACCKNRVVFDPPSGTIFAPETGNLVDWYVYDCASTNIISSGSFWVSVYCSACCSCSTTTNYTVTVHPGSNYLADDLCQGTNNTLAEVLPSVPDGTDVFFWDQGKQTFNTPRDTFINGKWLDGTEPLFPKEGFLLVSSQPTYQLTIYGCEPGCPGGCTPLICSSGTTLIGGSGLSPVSFCDLFCCTPPAGTEVQIWDAVHQLFTAYTYNSSWPPPSLPVGYSEFVTAPPCPGLSGFAFVTPSQSSPYGTTGITLSGTLSASGSNYPAQGETVNVTIDGNLQTTTISDATCDFSFNYNPSNIPASTIPYTITYFYPGDASVPAATNSSTTLTVTQVQPLISWSNPVPIAEGTPLTFNQLNATANLPGNFIYNPTSGTVLDTGTNVLSVIFIPTDTNDFTLVTNTASLDVFIPTFYWDPTGTDSTNGGGTGTWDNSTVAWWFGGPGDVAWSTGGGAVFAGTSGTVSVNGGVTADGLTFNTAGYIVGGNSVLTLAGNTPTITVPIGNTTIGCTLAGTNGLISGGPGYADTQRGQYLHRAHKHFWRHFSLGRQRFNQQLQHDIHRCGLDLRCVRNRFLHRWCRNDIERGR